MAFKSEFAIWREELEPPPRLTISERVSKWFNRPASQPPEQEMFVMRSVEELWEEGR